MTLRTEIGDPADPMAAIPAPPFDRLIEAHGSAARAYRRLVWLLPGIGLALAALGLLSAGSTWLAALGLVLGLGALVPWKKAAEHAERAEGLAVLKDEWLDTASREGAQRLRRLVLELYGAGFAGQRPGAEPA